MKLFGREPVTMVVTLVLPLVFLLMMGEVFGRMPLDPGTFRGVAAMNYYTPAYIGLVIASIGVVGLPVHLAGYRERGVLRRLRASPLPLPSIFGAQVIVSLVIALFGGILLTAVALPIYDVRSPDSVPLVIAGFLVSVLAFAAVGVFLGAVLPTTRAAQGVGLLLFFVMFVLSGAGPPREDMTEAMRWMGDVTPLPHVVRLLQDAWLGFGWNVLESLIVAGIAVAAALLSLAFFRWE